MTETCKITPLKGGPYLLEGLAEIEGPQGPIQGKQPMALCRCGASASKPFCDGSHDPAGFSGDKAEDRTPSRRQSYEGAKITIHDNRAICAHAGLCTEGLPNVWRMGQEPWIDADAATVDDVIRVIKSCPSGALSYTLEEETRPADESKAPAVYVTPKGPYVVTGDVELIGSSFDDGADEHRFTLCRCGVSRNKPFCDGSHWNSDFDGSSEA